MNVIFVEKWLYLVMTTHLWYFVFEKGCSVCFCLAPTAWFRSKKFTHTPYPVISVKIFWVCVLNIFISSPNVMIGFLCWIDGPPMYYLWRKCQQPKVIIGGLQGQNEDKPGLLKDFPLVNFNHDGHIYPFTQKLGTHDSFKNSFSNTHLWVGPIYGSKDIFT